MSNWELMVSMPEIRATHPDWTEDQCRTEFNRITAERTEAIVSRPQRGQKQD